MLSTGFVRKLDDLGRLVIPMELRKKLGIEDRGSLEIFVEGEMIILKKYQPGDVFTGELGDLIEYKGKKVSRTSVVEMAEIAGLKCRSRRNQ